MGGCQNYDPFWGTLHNRCRTITGIQKGTIMLTTTHMGTPHRERRFRFGTTIAALRSILRDQMNPKHWDHMLCTSIRLLSS